MANGVGTKGTFDSSAYRVQAAVHAVEVLSDREVSLLVEHLARRGVQARGGEMPAADLIEAIACNLRMARCTRFAVPDAERSAASAV